MKVRNTTTSEGIALGRQLARFADQEQEKKGAFVKERCGTCAFREGTHANGSPATLMMTMKCLMEHEPFYYHEHRADGEAPVCSGYRLMFNKDAKPVELPWSFEDCMTTAFHTGIED